MKWVKYVIAKGLEATGASIYASMGFLPYLAIWS